MKRLRAGELTELEAGREDKISKLPDKVILQIISSLPAEETIRTGVLSRRWKSMWKKIPQLKFDSRLHRNMFADHVMNTLLSHGNRKLERLSITIRERCDPMELAILLSIAFAKDISVVVLSLINVSVPVKLPVGSLNRQNRIDILKIMGYFNLNFPLNSVSFNCLKELHLYHIRFHGESSVSQLLKGCPVLQELVMFIYRGSGIFIFVIDSPSLLRLTLGSQESEEENFVIKTPRLKYLNIQPLDGVDSFRIENSLELVEATISRHDYIEDENILRSISSVQFLSMADHLEVPVGKVFHKLIKLELHTSTAGWCELLTSMFTCSPKLKILILVGGWDRRGIVPWVQPDSAADCLLYGLHTLEWVGLIWDAPADINVATYILKNAAKLMKATFTTVMPGTATRIKNRNEIICQLSTVPRASKSCHLLFNDYSSETQVGREKDDPDVADFVAEEE